MKKKLLLFAICLLGFGYVSAQWSIRETEIVLTEVIIFGPMDDNKDGKGTVPPDPNQFRATQDGTTITAGADTDALAHVTVRDQATGTTVADQDFFGMTAFSVPANGAYTIRIQSAGTAVEGQFVVK